MSQGEKMGKQLKMEEIKFSKMEYLSFLKMRQFLKNEDGSGKSFEKNVQKNKRNGKNEYRVGPQTKMSMVRIRHRV
jgi:hypothetical protein